MDRFTVSDVDVDERPERHTSLGNEVHVASISGK